MGEGSMRLRDTPPPTPLLAPPDFGFGSERAKKESLPPSPLMRRSKNCVASRRVEATRSLVRRPAPRRPKTSGASRHMPVLSVLTHTGLSTMCVLIILACSFAAWPIHLCITRPVARMLGLIN